MYQDIYIYLIMEHNNVKLQNVRNNVETWCNYIFHGLSSIHADTNNFNSWVAIDFEHFVKLSNQIGKPIREVIGYHRIQGLSDDRELPEGLDSNTNMLISTPIAPTMPAERGSNSSSTPSTTTRSTTAIEEFNYDQVQIGQTQGRHGKLQISRKNVQQILSNLH
jgi:hypothetical protein